MYEDFFDLKRKPFELVPNPDFLFPSRSHRKAITYLTYGIRERAGFILLTGEVGSGKTTLIRSLLRDLKDSSPLAMVFNTRVSSDQLLALINDDFGLPVDGKGKVELMRDLNDFLIGRYGAGQQPFLVIDEAQNLSAEHLEEVRLLSNLETERSKLLQIIMVGQPELRATLAQPELRQLRQRISICCHLHPLTREEAEDYILYRLERAGNRHALVFPSPVIDAIHQFSRGIPRLINIVCDFMLLAAYAEETSNLSPEMVAEVLGDIALENRYWPEGAAAPPVVGVPPSGDEIWQDLQARLVRLEARLHEGFPVHAPTETFSEQLEACERLVGEALEQSREEFARIDIGLKRLRREVQELKATPVVADHHVVAEKGGKPTGFWQRVLGRC